MEEKFEEIIRDGRKKIEDMSIEEMMHEQQLVDREIKGIINDLGYKRFRGEEIDEEYERDCEIRIRKLKQDFNIWGSEVRKKEKAYEDEKYSAACRYMLSITCDDEDDYIPSGDIIARYSTSITPDLPIEESENSLIMGDEPLSTIPATESDEVIKSSVENLVPIPSEFEGISDDTSDVPTCDNNCVNVESDLLESLINRDTSIVYSSKIDPILEEFADELAHIAPIPPGIVEADFDPNDDISSDDDDFYDCVDIEEDGGEIDLDRINQLNEYVVLDRKLDTRRYDVSSYLPEQCKGRCDLMSSPPMEKLVGSEPVSGPKTIKSILKLNSTFKTETLKGVTINEPSSARVKGNKNASASKTNSAPAGKLKNVKTKDEIPLSIVPQNAHQNKYKTQLKKNCKLCGLNNHISENFYKALFYKKYERTDHRTCGHAEYMKIMNMTQHLKNQGGSSSKSKTSRPLKPFPPCKHYEVNDHQSNDYVNYLECEIYGSYDP
ncbi:hypothetical protein Tco_0151904 [Tanacetum coccineum]